MKNKISVIVPVYNVQTYIERCIKSILAQTYSNIDLILIDDGSTDNSGRICDDYSKLDNRVTVVHTKNNGQSIARNIGLSLSDSEFIGFVDADDFIDSDYYEVLCGILLKNNDISCVGLSMGNNNSRNVEVINQENAVIRIMAGDLWTVVWNKLFRASSLKGVTFPEKQVHEEIAFNHKFLMRVNYFGVVDYKGYHYTKKREGDTKSTFQLSRLNTYKQILNFIDDLEENGQSRAKKALMLFGITHFIEMFYSAKATNQPRTTLLTVRKYFLAMLYLGLEEGVVLKKPRILLKAVDFYFYSYMVIAWRKT
ncbi:glycosyltransferase family 2 protein [Liquorilactobacillus uvarum]|uniref:glycosyltransferase family 2 protein n=1 Tax=Liquorilactobacillus uvarum TaxID=303240 RepID=UPI0012EE6CC2|nr:glycosyltransferase family 2 protein [Liquorilactobacillus uvarum]